jgi:hypothetical protein
MLNLLKYKPIRNQPFYKFYYKGDHSHPVQRTVLVTKLTRDLVTGYELREGNLARTIDTAPIKSYRRDRIAQVSQLRNDNPRRRKVRKTTLKKCGVRTIQSEGI